MPLVQTGEWSISALNGFCTAAGDIELCQLLAGGALAYPVARWLESSHETAVIAARQNYVKRFYSTFKFAAKTKHEAMEKGKDFLLANQQGSILLKADMTVAA